MKSLESRFNNITERNPNWSSSVCFAEAIKGQKFSEQTIHRWFPKLVDKQDYARSEKGANLRHLDNLSNMPEDNRNKRKSSV